MDALQLIRLGGLMALSSGRTQLRIGLIDGPVAIEHPDLAGARLSEITSSRAACVHINSAACAHGTFVAGILSARRGSAAPAICPNCTVLVRPIFAETNTQKDDLPRATPEELAQAVLDCIDAGARILNVSAALAQRSIKSEQLLKEAFDCAARRGVIVVVAAGNHGMVGSIDISSHPWVIPVVGYDLRGRPMSESNLGHSIGRRGMGAPGDQITSIGNNGYLTVGGTSAATPFVTGTIALLWSEFPGATAAEMKHAATQAYIPRRTTVVPPLLDAWAAYQVLRSRRRV